MPQTKCSYKQLIVWEKSMCLVTEIYKLSAMFPKSELYGLVSQIKRSAISIPSNIAEGSRRTTKKDFKHFLVMAYGSGSELETQIEIGKRLKLTNEINYSKVDGLLNEVMRMLNRFIHQLQTTD